MMWRQEGAHAALFGPLRSRPRRCNPATANELRHWLDRACHHVWNLDSLSQNRFIRFDPDELAPQGNDILFKNARLGSRARAIINPNRVLPNVILTASDIDTERIRKTLLGGLDYLTLKRHEPACVLRRRTGKQIIADFARLRLYFLHCESGHFLSWRCVVSVNPDYCANHDQAEQAKDDDADKITFALSQGSGPAGNRWLQRCTLLWERVFSLPFFGLRPTFPIGVSGPFRLVG